MTPSPMSAKQRRRSGPRFRPDSISQLRYQHRLTERAFADAIGFRPRSINAWMEGVSPPVEAVAMMMRVFGKPFRFFIVDRTGPVEAVPADGED